ncbi:serine/threonine protein kinase [Frankia sp. Ag45/Mut15]|uniref:Serine/threonine protein kinase n=1 Tax=Frankia umida TaxID=573489 RepID=A0ABT0K4L6_9ACTN|nr:serine/threonine-protein kinase [Frankia umida]MCK9878732.1 serine/threonine protein kinase [Frankia umida]
MTSDIADVGTVITGVDDPPGGLTTTPPGAPLRASDPTAMGDWQVLRRLGEGGMGTVYLGASPTGRPVAIKVIHPEYADVAEFRERFRQEMTHARQVAGFCTAEVLDVCPDAEFPYLVTEFVPGPTLAAAVRDGGPLAPADLERLAIGMASALTAIHAAGIAHHDLTPSNILLHPTGPRVIDFGIAHALGTTTTPDEDTGLIGTPGYVAPEQFRGGRIGAAADVFAWAAVMLFAATGRRPFGEVPPEGPPDVLDEVLADMLADVPGLPPALLDLVRRALQPNPDDRPGAGEVLLALLGETDGDSDPAVARALDGWRIPTEQSAAEQLAAITTEAPGSDDSGLELIAVLAAEQLAAEQLAAEQLAAEQPVARRPVAGQPMLEELAVAGAGADRSPRRSVRRRGRRSGPGPAQAGGRGRRAAVLVGSAALLALVATSVPVALGADRPRSSPSRSIDARADGPPSVLVPTQPRLGAGGATSEPGSGRGFVRDSPATAEISAPVDTATPDPTMPDTAPGEDARTAPAAPASTAPPVPALATAVRPTAAGARAATVAAVATSPAGAPTMGAAGTARTDPRSIRSPATPDTRGRSAYQSDRLNRFLEGRRGGADRYSRYEEQIRSRSRHR